MQNIRKSHVVIKPLLFILVIIFIIFAFRNFKINSFANTKADNKDRLIERADFVAESVMINIESIQKEIKGIAKLMGDVDDLGMDMENRFTGKSFQESTFIDVFIFNSKGICENPSGEIVDISGSLYYENAMNGIGGISSVIDIDGKGQEAFIIYEPIRRNNKTIGVVEGVCKTDEFAKILDSENIDDGWYFLIFDKSGDIITKTGISGSKFENDVNVWNVMQSMEFYDDYKYSTFVSHIANNRSGFINYKGEASDHFAYYRPMGINGWYIIQSVSKNIISKNSNKIDNAATALVIKIFAAVLLCGAYIIKEERRYQRLLINKNDEVRKLTDSIPVGVQKRAADLEGEFIYISEGFLRMSGYSREEIADKYENKFINTVYCEDVQRVAEKIKAYEDNGYMDLQYRIVCKNNNVIWVKDSCNFLLSDDNKPYFYSVITDCTSEKEAELQKKISNEKFEIAMSHIACGIFEYDINNNIFYHNEDTMEMYGVGKTIENGIEEIIRLGVVTSNSSDELREIMKKVCEGQKFVSSNIETKKKDGSFVWTNVVITTIFDNVNKPVWAIGTIEDISKIKEMEMRFSKEEHYREVYMSEAIMLLEINVTKDTVKIYNEDISVEGSKAFNYTKHITKFVDRFVDDHDRKWILRNMSVDKLLEKHKNNENETHFDTRSIDSSGHGLWVSVAVHMLEEPRTNDVICFVYIRNIHSRKERELQLQHIARRDQLTNIYNRGYGMEKIQSLLDSNEGSLISAFFVLDIDCFKQINDNYGHNIGDRVLIKTANLLLSVCRSTDVVSRLGGDEFVMFMNDVGSKEIAALKAEKIKELLKNITLDEKMAHPTVSIGIAFSPESGNTYDELYLVSDKLLYEAKRKGKDGYEM